MSERVRCPVCETETRRGRFPRHFADTHPDGQLRDTFEYSAFWAGVLPGLAVGLAVAQSALVGLGLPRPGGLREAVATAAGVYPESVPAFLAFVAAPVVAVGLGTLVVALARGPGQTFRRGWRPRWYELLLVATWLVPVVGVGLYVVGAGRRVVAVRYLREKLAGGGVVAADDLETARSALAANRYADAANAFETAGTLVQGLRDDAHLRNPTVAAHLDGLGRGCGMAAAICERQDATTRRPPA
ncbi:hypothetical protein [Halorubellus sp. PRR65]|uniref:hypothetical protein n=1 Tax=Halorubellus sp. PRR65 TaxID=3098148 RepID=UPI002B256C52|nr:hypothetical protein [Halorubellus sp. PRR65]